MKINKILLLFIIALFISCNIQQQEKQEVLLVQTDWEKYNLKGKVSEIQTIYERFYPDTLSKKVMGNYEWWNDLEYLGRLPTGHHTFSKDGFETHKQRRHKDSLFLFSVLESKMEPRQYKQIHDTLDYSNKKSIIGKYKFLYPLYDPYSIGVNYLQYEVEGTKVDSTDHLELLYKYTFDSISRIIEEKYYLEDIPYHHRRKSFRYNADNQVVAVNLYYREYQNSPLAFDLIEIYHIMMDFPPKYTMRYEYEYDEKERLTEIRFMAQDVVVWRERYRYRGDNRSPHELDRYIESVRTHGVFLTDNATEWYNEKADIIKIEYYDNQGNVVHTRFYDYEYDVQNNWVECRMYLGGKSERTEKPTRIARRTISYYPE